MSVVWNEFIVKTEKAGRYRLKRPVKLAFTFTPTEPHRPPHPFDPLACAVTTFGILDDNRVSVWWGPKTYFGVYSLDGARINPGKYTEPIFWAGHASTLTGPDTWSEAVRHNGKDSFVAINKSGSSQNVTLGLWYWHLAYRPLGDGCSIVAPSNWMLQAYVVKDAIVERTILYPEDLQQPIFTAPLDCNALPPVSTWTLYHDEDGVTRLMSEDNLEQHAALITSGKTAVTREVDGDLLEVVERLSTLEKSVHDIQTRLSVVEESTRLGNMVGTKGTKANMSKGYFCKHEEGLAMVRKEIGDLRSAFSQMERSTQEQLSAIRKALRTMERTVNAVGVRTDALESSFSQTGSELAQSRLSLDRLGRRVSAIEAREVEALAGNENDWDSSLPGGGSPTIFPSHPNKGA